MQTRSVAEKSPVKEVETQQQALPNALLGIEIGLLTGCQDRPCALGLAMSLVAKGVRVDEIGSDGEDSPELHLNPNLRFLNYRGRQDQSEKFAPKLKKVLIYYARLLRYAARSKPRIFHILWNNRFEYFDLLAPNKVTSQLEALGPSTNKRVLLSGSWGQFLYRYHRARFVPSALWADLTPAEWLVRKMGLNLYMQTASWLTSRELVETAGPWDTRLLGDDGEFFLPSAACQSGCKIRSRGESLLPRFWCQQLELHW